MKKVFSLCGKRNSLTDFDSEIRKSFDRLLLGDVLGGIKVLSVQSVVLPAALQKFETSLSNVIAQLGPDLHGWMSYLGSEDPTAKFLHDIILALISSAIGALITNGILALFRRRKRARENKPIRKAVLVAISDTHRQIESAVLQFDKKNRWRFERRKRSFNNELLTIKNSLGGAVAYGLGFFEDEQRIAVFQYLAGIDWNDLIPPGTPSAMAIEKAKQWVDSLNTKAKKINKMFEAKTVKQEPTDVSNGSTDVPKIKLWTSNEVQRMKNSLTNRLQPDPPKPTPLDSHSAEVAIAGYGREMEEEVPA